MRISYDKSLEILESFSFENIPTQKLFLTNAVDKVLAQDIIADHNSPEFPTSGMDGYAIKHTDQKKEKIKIIDKNPAGSVVESVVEEDVCIKTFTGSLMPKGSDTLIPIENVEVDGDYIIIKKPVPFGFATRNVGENYKKDEILINKGTKIGFAEVGVLASLNISQVYVYSNPKVAIASTGSEILDLGEKQTNDAQIRSSNHLTLEAIAKKHNAETIQLGIIKDDKESITRELKAALKQADIVVTTGGVSVGDYDFVKDVIKEELDAEVLFHGVNIKPGMHVLLAKKDDKFIVGLPGFAYSSTVTFILYVLPLIYKFRGAGESLPIVKAKINQNFPKKAPKTVFSACNVKYENGEYLIDFDGKKSGTSAILTNLLGSPALLIQEENSSDLKEGDLVDIILLNDSI